MDIPIQFTLQLQCINIRHSGRVHVVPAMVVVAVAHSLAENLENVGSYRERKGEGGGGDECT